MNALREIIGYYRIFYKYVGWRMYLVFTLTAFAAGAEAFGIALLLPLIGLLDSDMSAESSFITDAMNQILSFMGIDESVIGVLLFIGIVFFIKGLIIFAENGYKAILSANLQREIKGGLFGLYCRMEYGFYTKRNTGHFVNMIVSQVSKLIKAFESYKTFLSEIIITFSYLIFAFMISWEFATMTAVAGMVILLLFKKLNQYVKSLSQKRSREQTTLNKYIVQTLQSFKYIAATAQFEYLHDGIIKSIHRLTALSRNSGLASAFTSAVREPISVFLLLIIIIIQIAVLEAPLAPILVSLILINRAVSHIIKIQEKWQHTLSSYGGLDMVEREFEMLGDALEIRGNVQLPTFHDKVELQNVSFAYESEDGEVLKNVNLTIHSNSSTAFVGESGAGKTTLVDLLTLLLRPSEGKIFIDGYMHSEIDPISWRKQIGYVSQDTVVFDDTIANNITMWKGDYNKDEDIKKRVQKAAEMAFANEYIERLPLLYNTMVGDRGMRLSGGQKQRLFIARELYKNPRFLIMDEATSALDSESERYIQESINNLRGQTTVVIIAHRLSTIKKCNQIYVLQNGLIIENGTYKELLDSKKGFMKMVQLQSL